jgi:hypothetical protein
MHVVQLQVTVITANFSKYQWKLVKVVKVNFSTVQPIYTKTYKLQLQITVIITDSSKTLLTVAKCFRFSTTALNCIQQKYFGYFFISVNMVCYTYL